MRTSSSWQDGRKGELSLMVPERTAQISLMGDVKKAEMPKGKTCPYEVSMFQFRFCPARTSHSTSGTTVTKSLTLSNSGSLVITGWFVSLASAMQKASA